MTALTPDVLDRLEWKAQGSIDADALLAVIAAARREADAVEACAAIADAIAAEYAADDVDLPELEELQPQSVHVATRVARCHSSPWGGEAMLTPERLAELREHGAYGNSLKLAEWLALLPPLLRRTPMHADRAALMQSVLASPCDDTPRKLYADFLEEIGEQDRCDFVRVQLELARYDSTRPGDPVPCCGMLYDNGHKPGCDWIDRKLRKRERDLQTLDNSLSWFGQVPGTAVLWSERKGFQGWHTADGQRIDCTLHRGFVSSITLSWSDWLTHHHRLFWSPRQTVECPECKGKGFLILAHMRANCINCGGDESPRGKQGTGKVARPFTANVPCPECKGARGYPEAGGLANGGERGIDCSRCSGRGQIVQSLAETCQPLTELHITDHGYLEMGREMRGTVKHDPETQTMTCEAWPGLTIHLAGLPRT